MFDYRFNGLPNMLTAQMPFMPQNMLMTEQAQQPQIDPTTTGAIPQPQQTMPVPQGDTSYFPPAPDANRAPITPQDYQASLSHLQPQQAAQPQAAPAQFNDQSGGGMQQIAAFLQGLGRGNGVLSAIGGGLGAVQEQKQQNQTISYLTQRGIPEGEAQILSQSPQAVVQVLQNLRKGVDPKTALELQKLGYEVDAARLKAQGGGKSATEYGLNPIWGQDAQGNPVLGVLGKDGSFKKVDTGGFDISSGTEQIDLGDSFAIKDKRSGQIIGSVPKNLANAEREKKVGAGQGDAAVSYESMSSKLPGLEQVVAELDDLADKATYTTAGKALDWGMKELGMQPRDAALARSEYIAKVDNQVLPMLRDTFGAAFTVKEGETLRSTLGDPDKSPAEKKAVLRAFIDQKKRDIQALGVQGGVTSTTTQQTNNGIVNYSDYFKQ